MKRAVLSMLSLCLLAFVGCGPPSPPVHSIATKTEALGPKKKVAMVAMPEAVLGFYAELQAWPKDIPELQKWLEKSGLDAGFLSTCSDFHLIDPGGGQKMLLRFRIVDGGFSGDVEVELPRTPYLRTVKNSSLKIGFQASSYEILRTFVSR